MNVLFNVVFVVLLSFPPGAPDLAEVTCVPVASNAFPFPRVYVVGADGVWRQVPDTKPYLKALEYCAERLNLRVAVNAGGPVVTDPPPTPVRP